MASAAGGLQLPGRWCVICGLILITGKNYYLLQSRIALFELLKDVVTDETLNVGVDSLPVYICDKCCRKLNNVQKLLKLKEELTRDYWKTEDQHDNSVASITNKITSVSITPKEKGTQPKRTASFSPGTPKSKPQVKRRQVTEAERTSISNIPGRSRIPVPSPQPCNQGIQSNWQAKKSRTKLVYPHDPLDHLKRTKAIQGDFLKELQNEAVALCLPNSQSAFRQHDAKSLVSFQFQQQEEELTKHAPGILASVKAISESDTLDSNTQKTQLSILPKQMTAVSILLNARNQQMNSHQVINSLILKESASKKDAYARLNSRGVTCSYGTVQKVQIDLGKGFDVKVREWAKEIEVESEKELKLKEELDFVGLEILNKTRKDKGFQVVADNVDLFIQARHPTRSNYGSDLHMVNILAIENRITGHHLPSENKDDFKPDDIKSEMFLPNVGDNESLRNEWKVLCGKIISQYMPKLKEELKELQSSIPHKHMEETRAKSNVVDLGVLMHDENTADGIYHIMHHLHGYVPGHGTSNPHKVISAGDLLTCERESSCIEEQRNSSTASQRLEGLVPVISDFHTLANFYQVVWKVLYDPASAGDKGTLYQARNFLKTNNVTQDPIKNINAAEHLIEQYTIALVLAAALHFFGMKDCEDTPTKNLFQLNVHGDYNNYANVIMGSFVDTYAICHNVNFKEKDFCCQKCNKTYASRKNLQKHIKDKHPHQEPIQLSSPTSEDGVYNYSRVALGMGLLAMDFRDARQNGDGERIIRLHKFLLLHCKAAKKPKYSYHILRLLAQVHVFLSPRLSYELVWNRFANPSGRQYGNMEVDRLMEHHNRVFKESCRGLRGKISKKNIERISRSSQRVNELLEDIDKEVPGRKRRPSSRHKVDRKDAVALAVDLHSQLIFECQSGRMHHKFPGFPTSHFNAIDPASLHEWIRNTIRKLSRQNQFAKH
nr:uncharacterized protein LOC129264636 [Lytechinus pictus]